jgi:hypothetical protein
VYEFEVDEFEMEAFEVEESEVGWMGGVNAGNRNRIRRMEIY